MDKAVKPSAGRAGKRKNRNNLAGTRVPELGYYLIVTDTEETEKITLMDCVVKEFDEIIRIAEKNNINTGWSNPCFEIWMYSYFGEMPAIQESYTCCDQFARKFKNITGKKYLKNDRNIYQKLVQYGDEEKAFKVAKQCYKKCIEDGKRKPSDMWPASMVHLLVEEILEKCINTNE